MGYITDHHQKREIIRTNFDEFRRTDTYFSPARKASKSARAVARFPGDTTRSSFIKGECLPTPDNEVFLKKILFYPANFVRKHTPSEKPD